MYEFLRDLISNPLTAFISVIIVWLILHFLLVRLKYFSNITWVRFEYIWIAIGFIGVLALIDENRHNYNIVDLKQSEHWIEKDFETLASSLDNDIFHCVKYNNTGLFSEEVFDSIQARADSVCVWTNKVETLVDSAYSNGKLEITNLPQLNINNPKNEYSFERTMQLIDELNLNITKRDSLIKICNRRFLQDFRYSFGILLLIIAFGFRLTIISHKVRKENENHQKYIK